MTEQAGGTLVAAPLARRYGIAGQRRSVLVTDTGSISVVFDGCPDFDLRDLTPEQAYALAALVGDAGNERLAALLLDAVDLLKPELVR
jgi:hypothetical protein